MKRLPWMALVKVLVTLAVITGACLAGDSDPNFNLNDPNFTQYYYASFPKKPVKVDVRTQLVFAHWQQDASGMWHGEPNWVGFRDYAETLKIDTDSSVKVWGRRPAEACEMILVNNQALCDKQGGYITTLDANHPPQSRCKSFVVVAGEIQDIISQSFPEASPLKPPVIIQPPLVKEDNTQPDILPVGPALPDEPNWTELLKELNRKK